MKQIIQFLLIVCLVTSCNNTSVNFKEEAIKKSTEILEEAKIIILNDPQIKMLQRFEEMDTSQYNIVMEEIVEVSAKLLYEADIAYLLTPDCITKPSSTVQNSIERVNAIKDSTYHSVLTETIKELKDTKKLNYFSYKEFLIYHEQLKRISKELRSFCSEDFIESLEKMTN